MRNSHRNSAGSRSTLPAIKYLSLFSGIGGFELGIQKVLKNAECVGYSEIDPYAIKTYQKHFPKHTNFGDITTIKEKKLPDCDLLMGGFPCQSFSLAGKRKGFADPRGQMFFHIARILRAKKPRLFLLENVKGLLSHDNGRTFKKIIATLAELGYRVEWHVLNSKNHGVAQHRERVYIIGRYRMGGRQEIFPLDGTDTKTHQPHTAKKGSGIQSLYDPGYVDGRIIGTEGVSPAIVASCIPVIGVTNSSAREFRWTKDYSPVLLAGDCKAPKLVGYACLKCKGENKSAHGIYCRIRRLTPTECERLQGFPDRWTEGISDSQRYKCCGNAVTSNVVAAIVKGIFQV